MQPVSTLEPKRKIKVSERAIAARLKRSFAKEGKALKKCRRDGRGHDFLGDYYVIDVHHNSVVDRQVNLEGYARDLGLMAAWEVLDAPESIDQAVHQTKVLASSAQRRKETNDVARAFMKQHSRPRN